MTTATPISATEAIEQLTAAVATWRETRPSALRSQVRNAGKTPAGLALQELNKSWGQTLKDHEAKIAPQRQAYLAKRNEILQTLQEEKTERDRIAPPIDRKIFPEGSKGRPHEEPSDAVKIAAYRASTVTNKTVVRALLSMQSTGTLDRILTEGKDLYTRTTTNEGGDKK